MTMIRRIFALHASAPNEEQLLCTYDTVTNEMHVGHRFDPFGPWSSSLEELTDLRDDGPATWNVAGRTYPEEHPMVAERPEIVAIPRELFDRIVAAATPQPLVPVEPEELRAHGIVPGSVEDIAAQQDAIDAPFDQAAEPDA